MKADKQSEFIRMQEELEILCKESNTTLEDALARVTKTSFSDSLQSDGGRRMSDTGKWSKSDGNLPAGFKKKFLELCTFVQRYMQEAADVISGSRLQSHALQKAVVIITLRNALDQFLHMDGKCDSKVKAVHLSFVILFDLFFVSTDCVKRVRSLKHDVLSPWWGNGSIPR
jgi:hypothetical protein